MLSENEEHHWIREARGGNQHAFNVLYDAHVVMLFRFLNQFGDTHRVEEWTQRAFIKAFNKLHQFRENARFKTWLFRIGMNEMRTDKRKKWTFEEFDPNVHENPVNHNFDPGNWHSTRQVIRQLPNERKMVFLLFEVEGYSHKEISDMLEITENHSRVILSRTKKELQERITQ